MPKTTCNTLTLLETYFACSTDTSEDDAAGKWLAQPSAHDPAKQGPCLPSGNAYPTYVYSEGDGITDIYTQWVNTRLTAKQALWDLYTATTGRTFAIEFLAVTGGGLSTNASIFWKVEARASDDDAWTELATIRYDTWSASGIAKGATLTHNGTCVANGGWASLEVTLPDDATQLQVYRDYGNGRKLDFGLQSFTTGPDPALSVAVAANQDYYAVGQAGDTTLTATVTAGSGSETYAWVADSDTETTIGTAATLTVTPTVDTTYSCTVTDGDSTATATYDIVAYGALSASASGGGTIASGQSATLTAAGSGGSSGYSYSWDDPDSSTTASISVSPTATTTYSCTVTDSTTSLTATASTTVTVVASPTVSISPASATIASGGSQTLTATATGGSGSYSYSWDDPDSSTTTSISVSPTATTTYTCTVTDDTTAATGSASVVVTVSAALAATVAADDDEILTGTSATLTATATGGTGAGPTYLWDDPDSSTTASISVSPTATTTYSCTVTRGTETASGSVTVTVYQPLTASVSMTASTVIVGTSVGMTASYTGGPPSATASFAWDWGGTASYYNTAPTATTTYTVTVTRGSETATASATVTVVPVLSANLTASDSSVPSGTEVTLTATSAGGLGAGPTYAWADDSTLTASSRTVSPTATTTYTVTVTRGSDTATASVTVTVYTALSASISGPTSYVEGNDAVTLTVAVTGGSGTLSRVWKADGVTVSGETGATLSVSPSETTTYTCEVTRGDDTVTTADHVVTVISTSAIAQGAWLAIGAATKTTPSTGKTVWSWQLAAEAGTELIDSPPVYLRLLRITTETGKLPTVEVALASSTTADPMTAGDDLVSQWELARHAVLLRVGTGGDRVAIPGPLNHASRSQDGSEPYSWTLWVNTALEAWLAAYDDASATDQGLTALRLDYPAAPTVRATPQLHLEAELHGRGGGWSRRTQYLLRQPSPRLNRGFRSHGATSLVADTGTASFVLLNPTISPSQGKPWTPGDTSAGDFGIGAGVRFVLDVGDGQPEVPIWTGHVIRLTERLASGEPWVDVEAADWLDRAARSGPPGVTVQSAGTTLLGAIETLVAAAVDPPRSFEGRS